MIVPRSSVEEQKLRKQIRKELEAAAAGCHVAPMRAVFLYEQLVGKLDQRIERYEAAHNKFIQALNEA